MSSSLLDTLHKSPPYSNDGDDGAQNGSAENIRRVVSVIRDACNACIEHERRISIFANTPGKN